MQLEELSGSHGFQRRDSSSCPSVRSLLTLCSGSNRLASELIPDLRRRSPASCSDKIQSLHLRDWLVLRKRVQVTTGVDFAAKLHSPLSSL